MKKDVNAKLMLPKYRDKWVALESESGKIVGVSKSAKVAYDQAQEKGVKVPVLTRIPKNYGATYILVAF